MVGFYRRSVTYNNNTKKYKYHGKPGIISGSLPFILPGYTFFSKVNNINGLIV